MRLSPTFSGGSVPAELAADTWTKREKDIYEIGHQDGEYCNGIDWLLAFDEITDIPDDVQIYPWAVAGYIAMLEAKLKATP